MKHLLKMNIIIIAWYRGENKKKGEIDGVFVKNDFLGKCLAIFRIF